MFSPALRAPSFLPMNRGIRQGVMKRSMLNVFINGIYKILARDYKNPDSKIGKLIRLKSSDKEYLVFKQSELQKAKSDSPVFFEIEFTFKSWVPDIFGPSVPFFIGMPGFISKLWLVDNKTGDYAGQYVFASREDAEGYGNSSAQKLIKSLCVPGRHKWCVSEITN